MEPSCSLSFSAKLLFEFRSTAFLQYAYDAQFEREVEDLGWNLRSLVDDLRDADVQSDLQSGGRVGAWRRADRLRWAHWVGDDVYPDLAPPLQLLRIHDK